MARRLPEVVVSTSQPGWRGRGTKARIRARGADFCTSLTRHWTDTVPPNDDRDEVVGQSGGRVSLRELGARVRRARERLSVVPTQKQAGELIGRSRRWWVELEAGRLDPQLGDLEQVAALLGQPLGELLSLDNATAAGTLHMETDETKRRTFLTLLATPTGGAALLGVADQDFIEQIRRSVQHLVVLDNQAGPDQIAGMASQLFGSVTRRLRLGLYRPSIESDLMVTAAEAGELAGWLLYDANRHDEARKVNEAALYWATLAKDQGMADFILTNAGLQAIHLRQPGEAIQVTGRLLDGEDKMSPRVRALARVRRGRARAIAGDGTGAARDFEAARSLHLDGVRSSDPSWVWWVDELLITGHGALCRQESGDPKGAVDLFSHAIEMCPGQRLRDRFMWHVHLLGTLVGLREWDKVGRVAEQAAPFVGEVACGRVVAVLRDAIARVNGTEGVPLSVRDGVHHLDRVLVESGYPATI